MWKHGGLAAVAVAVLVIIALSLNALILVHSGRSTSMTTSGNEGRSRLAMLVHKVHRRMAAGEAPQVRNGGAKEPSPEPTKKPAAKAKKSEVAPPAPTASPTTVVEAPAAIVVVADEQPAKKAEPAVVVGAVASTTTNDEIAQAALAELAAAAATSDTAPVEQETSGPMREILSADKPKAPEVTSAPSAAPASTSKPKTAEKIAPATVTELGALWRPENCTPRKDGKPSKMHLWFTHVQEGQSALAPFSRAPAPLSQAPFCPLPAHFFVAKLFDCLFIIFFTANGRTYEYLFPKTGSISIHPGAGHVSHVDLRTAYEAFIAKSGDRCHLFSTILRDPIDRVISGTPGVPPSPAALIPCRRENFLTKPYAHPPHIRVPSRPAPHDRQRGGQHGLRLQPQRLQGSHAGARDGPWHHVAGRLRAVQPHLPYVPAVPRRQPNRAPRSTHHPSSLTHASVRSAMHPGSPNNRFTAMLTSVPGITNDPQLLPPAEARRVLDAAKDVLAQMPWFAMHEYTSDSIFSMDATFGLTTTSFSLLSTKDREPIPSRSDIAPEVLATLRERNALDLVRRCLGRGKTRADRIRRP